MTYARTNRQLSILLCGSRVTDYSFSCSSSGWSNGSQVIVLIRGGGRGEVLGFQILPRVIRDYLFDCNKLIILKF